ncbi:hypothetical protein [Dactylosporangium cerinum]
MQDLLAVQLPFEDRDMVPAGQDFRTLAWSLMESSQSSASALVTPRYASRSSTGRHHHPVIVGDRTHTENIDQRKILDWWSE